MAIRAEVYEEFSGTVKGSVKEKSGIEYLFELCEANQYSTNLELAPGDYHLSVDAVEKERLYRVLYDEAKFSMQEAEVKIENLQVTGNVLEWQQTQKICDHLQMCHRQKKWKPMEFQKSC
ncbi:MAG: hypothetical protein ACLU7M_04135 [Mediterraneibacter gnavus]